MEVVALNQTIKFLCGLPGLEDALQGLGETDEEKKEQYERAIVHLKSLYEDDSLVAFSLNRVLQRQS